MQAMPVSRTRALWDSCVIRRHVLASDQWLSRQGPIVHTSVETAAPDMPAGQADRDPRVTLGPQDGGTHHAYEAVSTAKRQISWSPKSCYPLRGGGCSGSVWRAKPTFSRSGSARMALGQCLQGGAEACSTQFYRWAGRRSCRNGHVRVRDKCWATYVPRPGSEGCQEL